jgi:glycosyltransferase involved in cell wall biosynthesis
MSSPAHVSVLLPVRDGERFLHEAIDSVLGQTLGDFELIVIDDGSSDETPTILEGYHDERLHVLGQDGLGLVEALNRAVAASRGAYLARMDADDVSLPERLERQVAFLERHPKVALVVPGVELIDDAGRKVGEIVLPGRDDELRRRLLLRNPITHGAVVIRREAVERAGGYRAAYGANEDYDLWRRLARDWQLAAIPDLLYRYRVHGAAVTRTDTGRIGAREALRDELWREPSLVGAVGGERDSGEARALLREAVRRRRFGTAARVGLGYLARSRRSA